MAVLPTDYTDATTPTGATTEYPATTSRGLNATHTQINTNTTDVATKASLTGAETLTNKTLTSPKVNQILDANGNVIFSMNPTSAATNYFEVTNNIGGAAPFLQLGGALDNTPFGFAPNGSGGMFFWNNTQTALLWRIDGTLADVGYNFVPKGAGRFQVNSVNVPTVSSTDDITGKRETLAAGSATVAPLKFTSGTNLTSAAAGAVEFDGSIFSGTIDTTSGRGLNPVDQMFRLTADSSAIGATIADYFGTNSAFPYVGAGVYEVVWYLWYTKTTAGTVTYTVTSTNAPVSLSAWYSQTPVGGIGTVGTAQTAGISRSTSATAALPVTGSLTTAVQHQAEVHAIYEANASAGNFRLRVTESAGTVTPLRGSFYRVRRLPAGNVGAFVA